MDISGTVTQITDVVIIVSGQQFHAHKKVLQAHSRYFKVILENTNKVMLQCISTYAFTVLLEYMYTSNLRVSYLNVYELIFSAQFLQMDRASFICKNFLTCSDVIIRNTCSTMSRNHVLFGETTVSQPAGSASQYTTSDNIIKPVPKNLASSAVLQNVLQRRLNDYYRHKMSSNAMGAFTPVKRSAAHTSDKSLTVEKQRSENESDINREQDGKETDMIFENKTSTLDIAWCDGPVKFQKVLNENHVGNSKNKSEKYEKDEQQKMVEMPKIPSNKTFYCIYCKISFKSHYCYQKHKRRHINPISDKLIRPQSSNENTTSKPTDINVPFYPCKNCGSKFPSYYFVHKHKKVCSALQNDKCPASQDFAS